jgi:hypothetical protein
VLGTSMKIIMERDFRSKKIPWAYYEFPNQRLNYSLAALKLLNIKSAGTRVLSGELLGYIRKEDRKKIFESLESGEGLNHFETMTSDKFYGKSKRLILSTFPHYYADEKKATGAAIFLRDPKISWHSRGIHQFEGCINEAAKIVFKQLDCYQSLCI